MPPENSDAPTRETRNWALKFMPENWWNRNIDSQPVLANHSVIYWATQEHLPPTMMHCRYQSWASLGCSLRPPRWGRSRSQTHSIPATPTPTPGTVRKPRVKARGHREGWGCGCNNNNNNNNDRFIDQEAVYDNIIQLLKKVLIYKIELDVIIIWGFEWMQDFFEVISYVVQMNEN